MTRGRHRARPELHPVGAREAGRRPHRRRLVRRTAPTPWPVSSTSSSTPSSRASGRHQRTAASSTTTTTPQAQQINEAAGFAYPTGSTFDGGYNVNIAVGGKFADGKGHASAYVDYRNVDALLKAERDYTNCSLGRGSDRPGLRRFGHDPAGPFLAFDPDFNLAATTSWTPRTRAATATPSGRARATSSTTAPTTTCSAPTRGGPPAPSPTTTSTSTSRPTPKSCSWTTTRTRRSRRPATSAAPTVINCDNPMLSAQQRDLVCTSLGYGPTDNAN